MNSSSCEVNMNQSNPSQPSNAKQRATLMAVGGFVVGASAMAAVLGLHNALERDESAFLRGANTYLPDDDAPGSPGATLFQGNISDGKDPGIHDNRSSASTSNHSSLGPSAAPTAAPSSANKNPFPTFNPTQQVETLFPTSNPTSDKFPTEIPTTQGGLVASGMITDLSILRMNDVGVRLKMHWEEGYYWQESTKEKWWCMACPDGECKNHDKIELHNCKKKSINDATFVVTSYGTGHEFRVANTNLCLQKMFHRMAIKLKFCKNNKSKNKYLQLFTDFKTDEKFDLRPVGCTDRCLSNHHHPKAGETIYAETCHKAHRVDTGYWVAY